MKTILLKSLSILVFGFGVFSAHAQTTNSFKKLAITARRMIDVRSGKVVPDVVVLIERNKIVAVGSRLKIPDSTQVMALGNVTILAGLIDAHTHLLHQYYSRYGDDNSNKLL